MKFSAADGWWGHDWYERVKLCAQYGFKGIEQLGWRGLDIDLARKTLDDNGVTSTAIVIQSSDPDNSKLISWEHGMIWEDSHKAFTEAFAETAKAARAMNVPNIVATTGNRRNDISYEKQFDNCVSILKKMSEIAESEGLMIVVEPLNILVDHKGYFLSTTEEAVRMIKAVDSPNCKILFDIYHQQITEGNLIRNITENIDLIGHIHMADNPGRKQPGTGEINYSNIFKAVSETNYNGWLAFECGRTVDVPELVRDMHELIDPYADK